MLTGERPPASASETVAPGEWAGRPVSPSQPCDPAGWGSEGAPGPYKGVSVPGGLHLRGPGKLPVGSAVWSPEASRGVPSRRSVALGPCGPGAPVSHSGTLSPRDIRGPGIQGLCHPTPSLRPSPVQKSESRGSQGLSPDPRTPSPRSFPGPLPSGPGSPRVPGSQGARALAAAAH